MEKRPLGAPEPPTPEGTSAKAVTVKQLMMIGAFSALVLVVLGYALSPVLHAIFDFLRSFVQMMSGQ